MKPRPNPRLSAELNDLRAFFAYNAFVRRKYMALISKLPKKVVSKDKGASFPSIIDIFVHVLDVYNCWIRAYETGQACERWQHRHETGKDYYQKLIGLSLREMKFMESDVDRQIETMMRKIKPLQLEESLQFTLGSGNKRQVIRRTLSDVLWHLIEEELQHRGELNALLWQENIEPPVTSWFSWKRSKIRQR